MTSSHSRSPGFQPQPSASCGGSSELRFTVRGPAYAMASPCSHRPSGGDVLGRVYVCVAGETTGYASERRLALTVLRRDMPTTRTLLRRVRGVNYFDSPWSFALQTGYQLAPPVGKDRPVQSGLGSDIRAGLIGCTLCRTGHRAYIEPLDADHVEPTRKPSGGLLGPVLSPVGGAALQLSDGCLGPDAPVRTPLAAGQAPLQRPQSTLFMLRQLRRVQHLTSRQRRRNSYPSIDANNFSVAWRRNRVRYNSECDMPSASTVTRDPIGPHPRRHCAGPAKPYPPDLRHPDLTGMSVQTLDVLGFQPDLPESLVHTSFAPRRPTMRAGEEPANGLREVAQGLLLHRLAARPQPFERGTGLSQLTRLLEIARRNSSSRPPMRVLLDSKVPNEPSVPAMRQQSNLLARCGRQPITGHAANLARATDETMYSTEPHRLSADTRVVPCRLEFR